MPGIWANTGASGMARGGGPRYANPRTPQARDWANFRGTSILDLCFPSARPRRRLKNMPPHLPMATGRPCRTDAGHTSQPPETCAAPGRLRSPTVGRTSPGGRRNQQPAGTWGGGCEPPATLLGPTIRHLPVVEVSAPARPVAPQPARCRDAGSHPLWQAART